MPDRLEDRVDTDMFIRAWVRAVDVFRLDRDLRQLRTSGLTSSPSAATGRPAYASRFRRCSRFASTGSDQPRLRGLDAGRLPALMLAAIVGRDALALTAHGGSPSGSQKSAFSADLHASDSGAPAITTVCAIDSSRWPQDGICWPKPALPTGARSSRPVQRDRDNDLSRQGFLTLKSNDRQTSSIAKQRGFRRLRHRRQLRLSVRPSDLVPQAEGPSEATRFAPMYAAYA